MRAFIGCVALVIGASAAHAQQMDAMEAAASLGSLLGAEQFCGLSYDQAAIGAWVEANVPPEAMDFPSLLSTMTEGGKYQQEGMTGSAKTAHCAGVARSAKHFGFIK